MIEKKPYLTEREAAEMLRLKAGTLQNKRVLGTGPAFYKFGSRVLYAPNDLEAWAAVRRRTSTSDATLGRANA
jgi:hypothetical protein